MDKNKIIESVKRQEEEKVAFSLKLPASVKEQLQQLSEEQSISMNSLIVATLQSFLNDDCGREFNKLQADLNVSKMLLADAKEYLHMPQEYIESIVDEDNAHDISKQLGLLHSIKNYLSKE